MYQIDLTMMPSITDSGKVKQIANKWTHGGWTASANILVIMLNGECCFTIPDENRSVSVKSGHVMLIPKGKYYQGMCEVDCEFYFFHFQNPVSIVSQQESCSRLAGAYVYTEKHNPNHYFRHIPTLFDQIYLHEVTDITAIQKKIVSLIAECDNEVIKKDVNRMIRLSALFVRILTLISEAAVEQLNMPIPSQEYPSTLTRILDYISANYTRKITLEFLSNHFLLSKQYIGRLFRTYMGTTVTHYINDHKLLHAPELLCQTVLNVSEIASYLGFSNVHYFSRLFKAKYSVCPSEFKPTERVKFGSNLIPQNTGNTGGTPPKENS